MSTLSPLLSLMNQIIIRTTKLLQRDYHEIQELQTSSRGTQEFANKAYARTKQILCEELIKAKSNFSITINGSDLIYDCDNIKNRFIINPIESLHNFARGIPYFATLVIAQQYNETKKQYENQACSVYAPAFYSIYYAQKDSGAWRETITKNGEKAIRLRVSQNKDLSNATVTTSNIAEQILQNSYCAKLQNLAKKTTKLSDFGSQIFSTLMVCEAKADLSYIYNSSNASANAAQLLIEESGGLYHNSQTNPQKNLYSNSYLLNNVLDILK